MTWLLTPVCPAVAIIAQAYSMKDLLRSAIQPGLVQPSWCNLMGPCSQEVTILMLSLIQTADRHSVIPHKTPGLKRSSCLQSGWNGRHTPPPWLLWDIYMLQCHKYFSVMKEKYTFVIQYILYSIIFCLSDERFSSVLYSSNFLKTHLEKSAETSFGLSGDLGT